MTADMTLREMNRRVFEGRPYPHVFFQPRFEPWYELHRERGTLPECFRGKNVFEAYETLGVSMRYIGYATGQPGCIDTEYTPAVKVRREIVEGGFLMVHETPKGELVTRYGSAPDNQYRIVEHPVTRREDLPKLQALFENTRYQFNPKGFAAGVTSMGHLGEPQFFVPRSPYQCLSLEWMGYDDFIYALLEAPEELDPVMEAIDRSHDGVYEGIARDGSVMIVNFGENVDARLMSPSFFERYHMPFYEKRDAQLKASGIFTTIHLDGALRPILKYFGALPMDGLEALTPVPQGDVTLEELKEHIGDKVLLDGVPALYFLPEFSMEVMQECVERIVDLFAPRLVLGISDELPMGAGPEAVERLEWIKNYCASRTEF
jgi:hypothetical protein